jgi:hypothetical protein
LPAKLGLEAAAGIAGAGRHGTFDVTQLHLHVRLQGAGESGNQISWRPVRRERVMLVVEPDLYGRAFLSARAVSPAGRAWKLRCALP